MSPIKKLWLFLLVFCTCSVFGQNSTGINNPDPSSKAALDIASSTLVRQGILVPRLSASDTTDMKAGITASENGLLFFDTDNGHYWFWNGTKWVAFGHDVTASPWIGDGSRIYPVVLNSNVGIGTITANAPLQFSNANANRKIVLWQSLNNDHQFIGLGVGPSIFRYQIPATTNSHVFYAASSATTSAELMRITGTGNVQVSGTVSASEYVLNANGSGPVPEGGIIMWSGAPTAVPVGYVLCDGGTYTDKLGALRTTPDLRGRFIVGYDNRTGNVATPVNVTTGKQINYAAVGNTGGVNMAPLALSEIPSHNHTTTGANDGVHSHSTVWTTLNGSHSHTYGWYQGVGSNQPSGLGAGSWNSRNTSTAPDHQHQVTITNSGGHSHTISNVGGGQTHENRPPYYVLAYIMKKY